jgi:hypothetical protein
MKFSFTDNGSIRGPKEYMDERGSDLLDDILNDDDDQFSEFLRRAPSAKKAMLVRLQTDYAGWKGQKEIANKTFA